MEKVYEVSLNIVTDKTGYLEIIKESINFLNELTDEELLGYVDVYDTHIGTCYEKLSKGELP